MASLVKVSQILCSFAPAMITRRKIQAILKGLLFTALTACAVVSCEYEKPEFYFPEAPVIVKSVRALYSDTITFNEGEYFTLNVRTTPYDLLKKVDIEIDSANKEKYPFATVFSWIRVDSTWNIIVRPENGLKSGDEIIPRFIFDDTVLYASPVVVNMIPKPVPIYYSLDVASDSISAFISGGMATVYLRTTPWNVLQTDTNAVLMLTDTIGGTIENVTEKGRELMPDSTWAIKVRVTNNAASTYIAFTLALPDTLVRSEAVELKKVLASSFNIRSIRTRTGTTFTYDDEKQEYSYCIPTSIDFSKQEVYFFFNGDKITIGDSVYKSGVSYTFDFSKPIKITLWKYDLRKEYTVKVTNTGLPILRIDTKGKAVTRRDTWVPGISMRLEMPDGTVDYEGTLSLKGRGNQTWSDFDKKPYAIKLDEKAKILGMNKQKRWILLANVKDRTLLRNDLVFWLSKQTNMAYTVSGQYVELVWNGEHKGNYYLCEHPRIDKNRINIHQPDLLEPEKGGYYMAIDAFLDYNDPKWADKGKDIGFWSTEYNMPYVFKDPEEDANGNPLSKSSAAFTYMQNYVNRMEKAIKKASSTNHEWANYLDSCSAVDFALIQELAMNHDAYNTWPKNGPKSTYLYKDSAGLMCFGPLWDFDYHTFTLYNDYENNSSAWTNTENQRLYQWEILKMTNKGGGSYYFSDLKRDPKFKALLIKRWNEYKVIWEAGFEDYVDQMAEKLRLSETYNEKLWGYPSRQNGDWCLTFDEAIQALKTAFRKRMTWIDQNIGKL